VSTEVEEERWEEIEVAVCCFVSLIRCSGILKRAHERALASCCYSITQGFLAGFV
jgi:hypothetical protein